MPTLTLTYDTAIALGLSRRELLEPPLAPVAIRRLEAMLVARGFVVTRTIQVSEIPNDGGFLLTQ
jgi:hypothetical protein